MKVLDEITHPVSHDEWLQVIEDIDYERKHSFFEIPYIVRYNYKNWRIRFDISSHFQYFDNGVSKQWIQIRYMVPFLNPESFQFTIFKEDWASKVLKIFGMQDIQINDPDFDPDFIIKSNKENLIIELLRDQKIKQGLTELKDFPLHTVKDESFVVENFPKDVNILSWETTVLSIESFEFQKPFYLFEAILDKMAKLRITDNKNPGLSI